MKYIYDLKVLHEGYEYIVDLEEIVGGEKPSKYQLEQVIPVYFDINAKCARSIKELRNEIVLWPAMILLCVAIIVACIMLV